MIWIIVYHSTSFLPFFSRSPCLPSTSEFNSYHVTLRRSLPSHSFSNKLLFERKKQNQFICACRIRCKHHSHSCNGWLINMLLSHYISYVMINWIRNEICLRFWSWLHPIMEMTNVMLLNFKIHFFLLPLDWSFVNDFIDTFSYCLWNLFLYKIIIIADDWVKVFEIVINWSLWPLTEGRFKKISV